MPTERQQSLQGSGGQLRIERRCLPDCTRSLPKSPNLLDQATFGCLPRSIFGILYLLPRQRKAFLSFFQQYLPRVIGRNDPVLEIVARDRYGLLEFAPRKNPARHNVPIEAQVARRLQCHPGLCGGFADCSCRTLFDAPAGSDQKFRRPPLTIQRNKHLECRVVPLLLALVLQKGFRYGLN